MAATYYIVLMLTWLVCATRMDSVRADDGRAFRPVNSPLRAINKEGIRRPLMRNDPLEGIYLMSDQRSPSLLPKQPPLRTQRRTHYIPRPRQQQVKQQQQQQQQGFFRNANGHHPPRPAPVPIYNHFASAGVNPGRERLRPSIQQHRNHFQPSKMPMNTKYPHNQQTTDQQTQPYDQQPETYHQEPRRPPRDPVNAVTQKYPAPSLLTTIPSVTKTEAMPTQPSTPSFDNPPLLDPKFLLNLNAEGDGYLTYLYLAPGNNQLDEAYLKAAANTGDRMRHPVNQAAQDHEIIIGAPSMNFDPYHSRGQLYRALPPQEHAKSDEEHVFMLLEDDWIPIPSPWEKYKNKFEKPSEPMCNQNLENKC